MSIINTVAGNTIEGSGGDGGAATRASLKLPHGVVVDTSCNIFISDSHNNCIRRVDAETGVITRVAGNGTAGYGGDNGPGTSAILNFPTGLAMDSSGNLLIVDTNNNRIRRLDVRTGFITTVVGNGLNQPRGVAVDSGGNLFIADTKNHRICHVNATTGHIMTVAGRGGASFGGEGGPGTNANLNHPSGVALDGRGNVFIADTYNHRIRRLAYNASAGAGGGVITTVAGNGTAAFSGDWGPAMTQDVGSALNTPTGVAVDGSGNLYIADYENHRIRRVAADTGIITTVVGDGQRLFGGDGHPGTSASLANPYGVAVDASGNLYIADTGSNRIRMFVADLNKIISDIMYFNNIGVSARSSNRSGNEYMINALRRYKQITGGDYVFPGPTSSETANPEIPRIINGIELLIREGPDARGGVDNYNAAIRAHLERYFQLTGTNYVLPSSTSEIYYDLPSSPRSSPRSSPQVQLRKNETKLSSNSEVSHGEEVSSNLTVSQSEEVSKLITNIENLAKLGYTSDNNEELRDLLTRYKELTGSGYDPTQTHAVSGGRRRRNKKSRRVKKSRGLKKSRRLRKSKN